MAMRLAGSPEGQDGIDPRDSQVRLMSENDNNGAEDQKISFRRERAEWADQGNPPESFSVEEIKAYFTEELAPWMLKMIPQNISQEALFHAREGGLKKLSAQAGYFKKMGFINDQVHSDVMNVICETFRNVGGRFDKI